MKSDIKKYTKKKLVVFSIDVKHKKHTSGIYKKKIIFPPKWTEFTLDNTKINEKLNGLAIITGKTNNIIVIDIDNKDHWNKILKENKQKDPDTVKAVSGSGGIHFYFKYDESLEEIKSKDHCFSKEYDIDIKTNGGCIIAPPTKYYNKNTEKDVEYIWENSILDYELAELPDWIRKLLLENKTVKKKTVKKKDIKSDEQSKDDLDSSDEIIDLTNIDMISKDDENIKFTEVDIELLVNMLESHRNDSYDSWLSVGMCLFNIDRDYKVIWRKWSRKNPKYDEDEFEKKWKSFKKTKDGLKIGSLLRWAKQDNPIKYEDFMRTKRMNKMIISKYPDEKLILGETVKINNVNQHTYLLNDSCLIKGCKHEGMPNSMYVDIIDRFMTIKCRHPECFGKTYPCEHLLMNKNEMNIAFNNSNVTININNGQDDELVEFQQINIFEDEKVNELVYNGLNGASNPLAKIIHYYHQDEFNFGEDENWYTYENNRWVNIGKKNVKLRSLIQPTLKELYSQVITYYKLNDNDKKKISMVKQIIKNFEDTTLKNNIMTELIEIYYTINNRNRDFARKLDSNFNLIGFENGVYDLANFEFREGRPDDNITMTVEYDYQDKKTEKYKDLIRFLEDIQPNKEEREYMLTYLSIGLFGNLLELFTILTGCGRNGKSKLIELLKATLGKYYGSVQSQLFTRTRPDANSPDPGLLSLAKKRIVIASEPEKNAKLNTGFIKFITGRDSTTLRNCHSNDMVDFSPKFITLLVCNDIPDCDDIDNAFSKRLRCINFPTEFVHDPVKENQKKIDTSINENFDFWKFDFMLLLIDYYKRYVESRELKPTDNILKWTNQYKEDTDIYLQFINEYIEESTTHVHCTILYDAFKGWFKNNNPNTKTPSNREFVNNLKKHKEVLSVKVDGKAQLGIKLAKLRE